MKVRQKRFQYWGSVNGKAQKLWTEWFNYNGPEEKIQQKGYGGNHLLNEYRTIEREDNGKENNKANK